MRQIVIACFILAWTGDAAAQSTSGRRRAVRHPEAGVAIPVAVADSYSLAQGSSLTIADPGVLANDTLNGASITSVGPLTGAEVMMPGGMFQTAVGGSVSLSAGGGFTYIPPESFDGSDTFRYVIRNGGASASAAVTLVVSAAELIAVSDSYSTEPENTLSIPAPGVLTNDTLAGAGIASFGASTGTEQTIPGSSSTARGGEVRLSQDGSFTYEPPAGTDDGYGNVEPFIGQDTFLYRIQRESLVSTATVSISVDLPSSDADFVITTPGHFYSISTLTGENPELVLTRGRTYTFQVNASPSHPFAILDAPPGSVTNNNITRGTLTFAVPLTATSYRYRCTTHLFGNVINTVP